MLKTPDNIRELQRKLYRKAKQEKEYRFYLLYDKVCRPDILNHAYRLVKANKGAPGIDGETCSSIEEREGGAEKYLEEIAGTVKLPAASRGASLAQLELKLRRPMRDISVMLNVPLHDSTSHTVSNRPCKISVLPQLPGPQLLLQTWKLAEQTPSTLALDDSYNFTDGSARRKG